MAWTSSSREAHLIVRFSVVPKRLHITSRSGFGVRARLAHLPTFTIPCSRLGPRAAFVHAPRQAPLDLVPSKGFLAGINAGESLPRERNIFRVFTRF